MTEKNVKTVKVAELTAKSVEVLEILKTAEKPLTVAELKTMVEGVNPSNLKALVNRGLVSAVEIEIEVPVIVKRKVNTYAVVKKD